MTGPLALLEFRPVLSARVLSARGQPSEPTIAVLAGQEWPTSCGCIIVGRELRLEIAPALREALPSVRPAATMVVTGLNEPEMKLEIEVTAFRG